jgi:hypothetical protein
MGTVVVEVVAVDVAKLSVVVEVEVVLADVNVVDWVKLWVVNPGTTFVVVE